MELLAAVSIAGWAFIFQYWNQNLKGLAPFVAISILVPFLFVSAYFELLKPSVILITLIGFGFFLLYGYQGIRYLRRSKATEATTLAKKYHFFETTLFLGLAILLFIRTKHAFVFGFDEFFWAQFTKSIHFENKLYNVLSPVLIGHYRYPPGVPLLQYFFTGLGDFKENALYLANGLVTISAFTALISISSRKHIIASIIAGVWLLFILSGLAQGYAQLMVDSLIGICLGLSLIAFLRIKSLKDIFWFLPQIWLFFLIKVTTMDFAVFLTFGLVTVYFDLIKSTSKTRTISLFLGILIQPLIPYLLWKRHLSFLPDSGTLFNPERVLNSDTLGKITANFELSKSIILKFLGALREINIVALAPGKDFPISFLTLFCFAVFVLSFSYWTYKAAFPKRIRSFCLFFVLLCSSWLAVHLLSYLIIFPEREGIQLASFARYMKSLAISLMILSAYFLKELIINWNSRRKYSIFYPIFFLLISTPLFLPVTYGYMYQRLEGTHQALETKKVRDQLADSVKAIERLIPKLSEVWFIFQNSKGEQTMITRFLVSPRRLQAYAWSLGEKYGPEDFWTANIPANEIKGIVQNQKTDYFFVASADNGFWNKYKELFHPDSVFENNTAFKVHAGLDEKYLFHPVK